MSQSAFAQFYHLVLEDTELQEKLRELADQATFIRCVVRLGAEHGYQFTAEDVHMMMQAQRRAWLERRFRWRSRI